MPTVSERDREKAREMVASWFVGEFVENRSRPTEAGRDELLAIIAQALASHREAALREAARVARQYPTPGAIVIAQNILALIAKGGGHG